MDIKNYIASGIVEMYVMGLCSTEEKDEIELLRIQYPELNIAILQFEKDLEHNLLLTGTEEPGNVTDEKILGTLQSLQSPAAVIALRPAPGKLGWLKLVAASAILLLGISGVYNYSLYKKSQAQELALSKKEKPLLQSKTLPDSDYTVLTNPAITPVAMYGVAPYTLCRCTMYWDKNTGKAYIMIHHLLPSPQDKKYQLWAMVNNKPVNVGMVNDKIRGRFIELENVPDGATAFTVTLENIGNNSNPSVDQTFLYGKI
jgi:hypothetical protein